MKKELTFLRGFILVLIAGMLLGSCSKKEEEATDNLVGKWSVSNVTLVTKVGTRSLSQYLMDELDLTSVEAQQMVQMINAMLQPGFTGTIEMKPNNTYTSNIGGTPDTGTWSLSQDGTKLTIDSDSEGPQIFDVLELSSGKLVLKITQQEDVDLDGDDKGETLTVTIEMTLSK